MKKLLLNLSLLSVLSLLISPVPAHTQIYRPAYEKFTLENGLNVILHRDTTMPVISINMAFHAGSARDPKGKKGLANLCGAFMLAGTKNIPRSELLRIQGEGGGSAKGVTTVDWTCIYSTWNMSHLETALWIEADRMKSAAENISTDAIANTVKLTIEQKSRQAANPLSDIEDMIYRELYPEGYPYRHVSTGDTTDLRTISVSDTKNFTRTFFVPANAYLAVGGNFDPEEVKSFIRKHFGNIPAGKKAMWKGDVKLPPYGTGSIIKEDVVTLSKLYIIFPTVDVRDPDVPVLNTISKLLTGAGEARLPLNIGGRMPNVTEITSYQSSQELDGNFWLVVTAKSETQLQKVYEQVMGVINAMADDIITDEELLMARNLAEMEFYTPLENFYGIGGRCDVLNLGNLYTGNPAYSFNVLENQMNVTAFSIKYVLKKYFTSKNKLVLSVVQPGKRYLAATGD